MTVEPFKVRVIELALDAAAAHGFALAGGKALAAHGLLSRPTQDTQPTVSALERGALDRAGLSTIRAYVEALGGTLEVVADFGDRRLTLG